MAETLSELVKERDELAARQLREDGFAGAAPGNNRPRTDEERADRAEGIKRQIAALKERDAVAAIDRTAKARAAREG